MRTFITILLFSAIVCSFTGAAFSSAKQCRTANKKPVITFIVPDYSTSMFWSTLVKLMQDANEQLGMELRIHYIDNSDRSRFNYASKIDDILSSNSPSDYLVSFFLARSEKSLLSVVKKHNVHFFSFNSPLTTKVIEAVGLPRQPNKNWIAHISPDDEQAGFDMADYLITNSVNERRKIQMLALNGDWGSDVAEIRKEGLMRRVAQSSHVTLLQVARTNWSYDDARQKMKMLLKRFDQIDAIWSASDEMAIAAVAELEMNSRRPTSSPKIASIDWTPSIVPYLDSNKTTVSFGGHIFEGIWLLGLIYDHYHSLDFYPELGGIIKYRLRPVGHLHSQWLLDIKQATFDFSLASKCFSSGAAEYRFDALSLLKQNAL